MLSFIFLIPQWSGASRILIGIALQFLPLPWRDQPSGGSSVQARIQLLPSFETFWQKRGVWQDYGLDRLLFLVSSVVQPEFLSHPS
jgi:hypothetical protein